MRLSTIALLIFALPGCGSGAEPEKPPARAEVTKLRAAIPGSALTVIDVPMFDAKRHEALRMTGHESTIFALAISPNGRLLASGDADSVVQLWDLRTGKLRFKLTGQRDTIRCLEFSSDSKQLVSAGSGRLIKVWDTAEGKQVGEVDVGLWRVHEMAIMPEGDRIVVRDKLAQYRFWNLSSWDVREILPGALQPRLAGLFRGTRLEPADGGEVGFAFPHWNSSSHRGTLRKVYSRRTPRRDWKLRGRGMFDVRSKRIIYAPASPAPVVCAGIGMRLRNPSDNRKQSPVPKTKRHPPEWQ